MIQITKMQSTHLDEAIAIEARCFADPWSREMIASEIEHPGGAYFAACHGKTLVGYAGMMQILDEGHIHNVAVTPAYRKKGIGRALIQAMIKHARENEINCLLLEVRAGNEAAISLYQGLGFKNLATRPNYYRNPCEDARVMILELASV